MDLCNKEASSSGLQILSHLGEDLIGSTELYLTVEMCLGVLLK